MKAVRARFIFLCNKKNEAINEFIQSAIYQKGSDRIHSDNGNSTDTAFIN